MAVPLRWSTKERPGGRPSAEIAGVGYPQPAATVTGGIGAPAVAERLAGALVMVGTSSILSRTAAVAGTEIPLDAVIVTRYDPPVPGLGVPSRVAEPLAPATRLTPAGSGEDWIVGTGKPEALTTLYTGSPTLALITLLRKTGGLATVSA